MVKFLSARSNGQQIYLPAARTIKRLFMQYRRLWVCYFIG
jgi:hypothetical protein